MENTTDKLFLIIAYIGFIIAIGFLVVGIVLAFMGVKI